MNHSRLNDDQLRAVLSRSKRLLILAGAGSGKTTTLTESIAERIADRGVSGSSVLALTFTNKAAREMKDRLLKVIPEAEVHKITVGTFHAVSLKFLRESGHRLGYDDDLTVYSPDECKDLMIWINKDLGEPLTEKGLEELIDADPEQLDEKQAQVFSEYLYRLKQANAIDFRRMLTETIRLLRDGDIRAAYHERYRFIFVDEYQDTDRNQYTLHREIDPEYLFCVGDSDQAIYGWRGAILQIILDFMTDNALPEKIILEKNYRSGSKIIRAANSLIRYNRDRYEKALEPVRPSEGVIRFEALADQAEELRFIVHEIRDLVRQGRQYQDIAVLYRKNFQGEALATVLRDTDIPFVLVSSRRSVWESSAAKEIVNMLNLIRRSGDDFRARKFLKDTVHLKPDQIEAIEIQAIEAGTSIMKAWSKLNPEHTFPTGLAYVLDPGIVEMVNLLVNEFQIAEWYQNYPDKLTDYAEFMKLLKIWEQNHGRDYRSFLDWYALRDDQDILDLSMTENKVRLMTIHGAKGLEFPVVFMIGCTQHNYPARAKADIEEERRIFYVGITRAMDRLYLTRYINEERYNYHVRAKITANVEPSQFIREAKGGHDGTV